MARVLADDASVFDMTGVNEDDAGSRVGTASLKAMPTIVRRASSLAFEVEHSGVLGSIRIYDVRGQLVKNLITQTGLVDHGARISWPLVDESGRILPAGLYFIRHENEKNGAVYKLIVID